VQPGPFVSYQAALRRCRLNLLVRFCLIACALRGRMDPGHSPSGALTVTPWPKTAEKKFTKTPYSWPPIVLNDRLNLAHSFEKNENRHRVPRHGGDFDRPRPHKGRAKETENSGTIERLW
jgi:hypothetical protein